MVRTPVVRTVPSLRVVSTGEPGSRRPNVFHVPMGPGGLGKSTMVIDRPLSALVLFAVLGF